MGTPDLDHDGIPRLGNSAGFAQSRHHVVCEEKRGESGHEIEDVVVVGEGFHVADAQVCVRNSSSGQVNQGFGGVEAEGLSAAVRNEAQECADAAADVEYALARLERARWSAAS